jgi:NADP-dependent 3-hydroxy acid dehydrogenase YdfG
MENIKDKVIIITGASSGMGAATARKLTQQGAKVVLAARREDQLLTLEKELGSNALAIKTDVSKRQDMDHLIKQTIAKFGQVDVLWNNAGIMPLSYFDEGKVEEWDQMIDVNIRGVLHGIQAVLPYMLEKGKGHILTTSSVGGLKTFQSGGVYSATKHAVRAIMDTLLEETAGKIRTTTIYPGAVNTELGHGITSKKVMEHFGDLKDLTQLHAEDIANAVIYAISQPEHAAVNDIVIRPVGRYII